LVQVEEPLISVLARSVLVNWSLENFAWRRELTDEVIALAEDPGWLPIPLGGNGNHFGRVVILQEVDIVGGETHEPESNGRRRLGSQGPRSRASAFSAAPN
jgi:hypothetical protein